MHTNERFQASTIVQALLAAVVTAIVFAHATSAPAETAEERIKRLQREQKTSDDDATRRAEQRRTANEAAIKNAVERLRGSGIRYGEYGMLPESHTREAWCSRDLLFPRVILTLAGAKHSADTRGACIVIYNRWEAPTGDPGGDVVVQGFSIWCRDGVRGFLTDRKIGISPPDGDRIYQAVLAFILAATDDAVQDCPPGAR